MVVVAWILILLKGLAQTGAAVGGFVTGAVDVGDAEMGASVVGEVDTGAALFTNAKMMLVMIDKVYTI